MGLYASHEKRDQNIISVVPKFVTYELYGLTKGLLHSQVTP